MAVEYLQLLPGSELPDISHLNSFLAIMVIDETAATEWQNQVSDWLVVSGCLYMSAWGKDCCKWHVAVDIANMKKFNFGDIPEESFVMTTCHHDEPLSEVFWFAQNCAFYPTAEPLKTLILHISNQNKEKLMLSEYNQA